MNEDRRITAPPRDETLAKLNELCDTPQWAYDALALLREIEFAGYDIDPSGDVNTNACPVCGGNEPGEIAPGVPIANAGHKPGCGLAALLARFHQ